MSERSPRERIAALKGVVAEAEGALAALEGRPVTELWAEARRGLANPPAPIAPDPLAPSGPSPSVVLLVDIGKGKLELGDASGAELALRFALQRVVDAGSPAEVMPQLVALEALALAECGRGDQTGAWLDALGAQVDALTGVARVDGLVWEAWARLHLGRLEAAADAADTAIIGAESSGAPALRAAQAHVIAAWSAILRGMPALALRHVAGLEAQLPLDDDRTPRSDATIAEAVALAMRGDLAEAKVAMQRGEAQAAEANGLRAVDHVDAVAAWVLVLQGQPAKARPLAQRAQRGLPPAPTLERVLPALVEAEACLASAAGLPDVAGAQMATLLTEGRRLAERIRRATQAMGATAKGPFELAALAAPALAAARPATTLDAQARRIAAELEALFGLHSTARALAELEALSARDDASSLLEQARALSAVALVRARLGDASAATWRKQAAERASEAGANALARRLELRAGEGGAPETAGVTGTRSRELELLLEVGRAISAMLELDPLLERIMDALIELLDGERGFLMLYDEPQPRTGAAMRDAPLRVRVARNMAREVVVGADAELSQSVVSEAKRTGEPVIVNDAGSDDRFANKASVLLLNLRSVLCMPLRTNAHDFGIVYVENRSLTEIFGARHLEFVRPLTAQAALAIDNAFAYQRNQKLYEETLSVARARERILNHVSHELKTPIAIVSGALKMVGKKLADDERTMRSIVRAERNIQRLIDIQQHMLDIYEARHGGDDDADRPTRVRVEPMLRDIVRAAVAEAKERELELLIDIDPDLVMLVAPEAFRSSLAGLFRNAIENTPDEGRVAVIARADAPGTIAVVVRDHGVGISAQNLPHVFEGFFHTQATERYSSRRPFDFDAGGKGLDLLRIRAIAERNGWDLSLDSTRCRFIPSDDDICPGRVSACSHCVSAATCHDSGGTEVRLVVPATSPIAAGDP